MDLQPNNSIIGLPTSIIYNNYAPMDETNSRIQSRQFPSSPLEPNFTPRAVSTKFTLFPVLTPHKTGDEPRIPYPTYNSNVIFNPGNSRAPVSGFNIDLETDLRNQTTALQHGAIQNTYIPSSTSDLYNVSVISRPSVQPHPELFTPPVLNQQVHPNIQNAPHIGKDTFHNNTRVQLKEPL